MRAGKLLPVWATRLRGRSVILPPEGAMAWHSTGSREELLLAVKGRLTLEIRDDTNQTVRAASVLAGQCTCVPQATWHRVVNRSTRVAQYVYVTG